jgi:hypothetical protein
MQHTAAGTIRPVKVLYDVRKAVSEILNKQFTEHIDHQVFKPDQKILALWAAECTEHVLQYFEEKYPKDDKPRRAIETLRTWIETGVFKMATIRKASLDAHSSARRAREDGEDAACFAAHAAGQAVGTAHVNTHSLACSVYGIRAAAAYFGKVDAGLTNERNWQLQQLRLLVR